MSAIDVTESLKVNSVGRDTKTMMRFTRGWRITHHFFLVKFVGNNLKEDGNGV